MEFKEEIQRAKNLNDQIKLEKFGMTHNELQELRWHLVDRIVDNMSVEDLVEYVAMDLDTYYDNMLDQDFLAEAEDHWQDYFPDVIQEIQEDF